MLPRTLCRLNTRPEAGRLRPSYLSERDLPWLRALLDEHARFAGRRRSELAERLNEPLPVRVARHRLRLAVHVLERALPGRIEAALPPAQARFALFRRAAESPAPRARLLEEVAAELGVGADALETALFADLRGEQRVRALPDDYTASRFALEINAALVAGLLARAARVLVRAWGDTDALVRSTRRSGLICSVRAGSAVTLDISGPFALFRHTSLYRRALAALVPRLGRCDGFELGALCALGAAPQQENVIVRSSDPLASAADAAGGERHVERRFAADFPRATRDWELIHEPPPVAAHDALIFADFELVHRRDPSRRWLLEIAGYYTREYLERKLEMLRSSGMAHTLLCVDVTKGVLDDANAENTQLVRYRRTLDPALVLAIIDRD